MKKNITYSQLFEFNSVAGAYAKKNPDNKLSASIKNFAKQIKKCLEEYYDELDNLQLNNCLTDPKTKAILYSERKEKGQPKERLFSVEGELKLKREIKELMKQTVEMHSRIPEGIDDLIATLNEEEIELFAGLVIPEQKETEKATEK